MDAGNRRRENSGLIDLDALMREAGPEDSGAVALEAASPVSPASPEKRKVTLIAPPKNEPPKSETTLESMPALVTPIPGAPRVPEKLTEAGASRSEPARSRSYGRPLVVLGVALGLAGGGAIYSQVRAMPFPKSAPVAVITPHEAAAGAPRPLETSTEESVQPSSPSANELPSVASANASAAIAPAAGPIVPGRQGASGKPVDAVVTTTELIPESAPERNDLGRAMHDAVGEGSSRVAKVEGPRPTDARTLRPSPGAVIGALNAVLPAARECLGPDDAIRVGTVTFRSDGAVAKVELDGKRDSDDCIRSAVSRARVEPFSDDAFTTRVTVRP